MNKTVLAGRFTAEPEIRYSQGEKSTCIAGFTLAVDRKYKREGEPTADFIRCAAFGKVAEHIEKYYHKGMKTILDGRIQTRNYENREGQRVYVTEVVVENMEFAESKAAGTGQGSTEQHAQQGGVPAQINHAPQSVQYGRPQYAPSGNHGYDGFMNIPDGIDEELPFT